MKDQKVAVFDCFGLFASDAFNAYFSSHYGEKGLAIKNHYCSQGDRGELTYEDMMILFEKELGLDIPTFHKEIAALYHIDHEMLSLAAKLREHHTVILLSNVMNGTLEHVFANTEFFDCFDFIIESCKIHMAKPDRPIFDYALSLLSFSPETVLFFDDNPANMKGAIEAGMEGHIFTNIDQTKEILTKKGFIL